ncbi:polysaccharide deacetylase family protein [Blautia liquoris]|uniref:Polysaccharide deacetylase family protein n=1 Tax=Blautia liquoris TaxID=2779518 RepID=A0A7M2RHQ0_9FIRM|nr:polysaccharide deacetylase family protein [Blautia liquoris]QOV19658.1 polysaccharide deacetylase family protein [Blautia liquoris]
MDKEKLRKIVERNRRRTMFQNCMKVVVCVLVTLVLVTVGWKAAEPFAKKGGISTDDKTLPVIQVQAGTNTQADGSGDASKELIPDDKSPVNEIPGWQADGNGWWYAADSKTLYSNGWLTIDGQRYHFGSSGYMDTGWTPIGGKGYYFQDNGIYDPNRDPKKVIALTFDDGPGPYTNTLLDILQQNHVKATFFMQGVNVKRYGADTIPRMVQLGCMLGNHSYDHPDLLAAGPEVAKQQIDQTDQLIAQYNNGAGADVIRFPYGKFTKEMSQATGRSCWFWDLDTRDWETKNTDATISAVLDHVNGGDIILLHDIHETTVAACQTIIPELINRGYDLVTVRELAASRGYETEAGVTYYGFTDRDLTKDTVTDKNR